MLTTSFCGTAWNSSTYSPTCQRRAVAYLLILTPANMRQHATACDNMRRATSDLFIEINRQRQNDPARARVVGLPGGGMRLEDPPVAHLRSALVHVA